MHQLDRRGGDHDLVVLLRPELRGKQGEQRAKTFATRLDQVQRRVVDGLHVTAHHLAQQLLDIRQPARDRTQQRLVGDLQPDTRTQFLEGTALRSGGRHRHVGSALLMTRSG